MAGAENLGPTWSGRGKPGPTWSGAEQLGLTCFFHSSFSALHVCRPGWDGFRRNPQLSPAPRHSNFSNAVLALEVFLSSFFSAALEGVSGL